MLAVVEPVIQMPSGHPNDHKTKRISKWVCQDKFGLYTPLLNTGVCVSWGKMSEKLQTATYKVAAFQTKVLDEHERIT